MDLEEIEDNYRKEIQKADDEFLQGMKDKRPFKEIEEEYKNKLKMSKMNYSNLVKEAIKNNKLSKSNFKKSSKKEKIKPFKVESGRFDIGFIKKISLKLDFFIFKCKFKVRNVLREKTPYIISYNYIKSKIILNKRLSESKEFVNDTLNYIKTEFLRSLSGIKEGIKNISKKLSNFLQSILNKFTKKKIDEKSEGKKDFGKKK